MVVRDVDGTELELLDGLVDQLPAVPFYMCFLISIEVPLAHCIASR